MNIFDGTNNGQSCLKLPSLGLGIHCMMELLRRDKFCQPHLNYTRKKKRKQIALKHEFEVKYPCAPVV